MKKQTKQTKVEKNPNLITKIQKNSYFSGPQKLKISKEMTFAEIMGKNPEAGRVLMEKGMHCVGCGMAMMETLEQGAIVHGLNPDELVKELNSMKKK